ncbi:hypothetical protein, partial [Streptococcus sp. HMSC072D03]|uniref:hypothetical protein n=1 Tax=Streptococcus sp. HMSC072D03 TaxID=1739381 RepID=UPI001C403C3E
TYIVYSRVQKNKTQKGPCLNKLIKLCLRYFYNQNELKFRNRGQNGGKTQEKGLSILDKPFIYKLI